MFISNTQQTQWIGWDIGSDDIAHGMIRDDENIMETQGAKKNYSLLEKRDLVNR